MHDAQNEASPRMDVEERILREMDRAGGKEC